MMKQKIYLCKSKVNREKLDIREKKIEVVDQVEKSKIRCHQ